MTNQTDPSDQPKPFYRRWWFIVTGIVVVLFIAALSGGNGEDEPTGTTTIAAEGTVETTTPTGATATTRQPTTTTTEAGWESFTAEGSGDDVIDFSIPDDDIAVVEFTHSGSGNFAVISYTAGGERIDLLVNTIGSYQGARPVNLLVRQEVGELEITADGTWTVTARPVNESPTMTDSLSGTGDEVVLYLGSSSRLTASHNGESNFAIWAWSTTGRDLLVNDIGPYEGTVRIDPDTVIIEITADGDWTLQAG